MLFYAEMGTHLMQRWAGVFMQRWVALLYAEVGRRFLYKGGQALFYAELGTHFFIQRLAHAFICRGGHTLLFAEVGMHFFYPKVGKRFFLFTLPR